MPADQKRPRSPLSRGNFSHDISKIGPELERHPHCTVMTWHMRSALRTTKLALAFLVAASSLLATNRAQAQTGGTTGTTTASALAASDFTFYFKYYDAEQKAWVQMNDTQRKYFFNRARCECTGDTSDYSGYFKILIRSATETGAKIQALLTQNAFSFGVGRLYAGNSSVNCLNPAGYPGGLGNLCTNLEEPDNFGYSFSLSEFQTVGYHETQPIPVARLFNSLSTPTTCGALGTCSDISTCANPQANQTVYLWAQTTAGSAPDTQEFKASLSLNGALAFAPFDVSAKGGNEALTVRWDWQTGLKPSADPNFLGVQIFCQRGADNQVFKSGSFGRSYMTAASVCPDTAPATSSYGAFSQLDPNYLCSGLLPSTTNSYRIKGLQNGITYGVGVAAIDRYGNVSAISNVVPATPIPTVDFYTEYKSAGGDAQGGFCALASQHARPGVLTLAGLAILGLVLRRRVRSRRQPPGAGTIVMLVAAGTLTAGQAHAQPLYHDGSFVQDRVSEAWGGSSRHFAIEARFGLYMPNIDSEFSGTGPKPQANVFGTKRRPMWQMEFDWEFLQAFGTFSVGGVIGYYKENAQACTKAGLNPSGECTERSGDNTSLRLIPLAALLIYRLDEAAERWKIPFVPYAKIGLNYTIWTVTDGNGDVPEASGGKGQGGTMGWQAAVGLSLRLDFIDPGAARGFDADSGVNHTYAFFELAHVDGSGLYRKDVLRVGDNTWFAGMMFEF